MTALAPHLSTYLLEHLPRERGASRHTIDSYAYSFQLLVRFAAQRLRTRPCEIEVEQLNAGLILDFLDHIETSRDNTPRTRNARLAAFKSFFRFLEYRAPGCLNLAMQVHAIPSKRFEQPLVDYLTRQELQTLLDAPDCRTESGVRGSVSNSCVTVKAPTVTAALGWRGGCKSEEKSGGFCVRRYRGFSARRFAFCRLVWVAGVERFYQRLDSSDIRVRIDHEK